MRVAAALTIAVLLVLFTAACAREDERAAGRGATGPNVTGRGEDPPRGPQDFTGTSGVGGEADISPHGQRAEETWSGQPPAEQRADRFGEGAQQGAPAPALEPGEPAGEADRTTPGTTGANWLLLALIVAAVIGGVALALRARRA